MLKGDVTAVASVPECRRPLPNVDEQRTVEVNLNTKDRSITWKNKDLVSVCLAIDGASCMLVASYFFNFILILCWYYFFCIVNK